MAIPQVSADTNIETYSSATANTGGNSGSESIQTGDASASSKVENKINSENGTSTVKTEVKAEANGEKEEKKVEETITNSNKNVDIAVEANTDEPLVQDQTAENINPQPGIMDSVVAGLKDFFNKIKSIFS